MWVQADGQFMGWFHSVVLHKPGAFQVVADGYQDCERNVAAKLRRELEMPLVSREVGGVQTR